MKKLSSVARINEIGLVARSLVGIFNEAQEVQTDAYLNAQIQKLVQLTAEMDKALYYTKAKSELEEKDMLRDNKVSAINSALKGYMALPAKELAEPAERLWAIFSSYGVAINEFAYAEESNVIFALLANFDEDAAKKDIAALPGMLTAVEELREAQDDFHKAFLLYNHDKSDENTSQLSATKISKPMLGIINDKIVPYITAMIDVDADKYSHFHNDAAQLIEEQNQKIATRSSKKTEE